MTQKGSSLTVDVSSVGATFAGVLNTAGTELAGTWTQGPSAFALTLKRAAKTVLKLEPQKRFIIHLLPLFHRGLPW